MLSCDHAYWRDVGMLDAYHHSPMDLVPADPFFNLYNQSWPIHTSARPFRPPSSCSSGRKAGRVLNSLVCSGATICGATAQGSEKIPPDTSDRR